MEWESERFPLFFLSINCWSFVGHNLSRNVTYLCIAVKRNQGCHASFRAPFESEHGDRVSSFFINKKTRKEMKTSIYYVVSQGDVTYVASQKAESGQLAKCVIRLREFGGSKFGNEYICTMFGNLAGCRFYEGDLVAASLRFQVHEVNGALYQEVVANDVVKLSNV
jgi:hypothetical protein